MKRGKIFLFALCISLFFYGSVWAAKEGMKRPKAEYSGEGYMETEQFTIKAKVYRASDKERREQEVGGAKQILITRDDKNLTWMCMPDQKMCMEMSLKQGQEKTGGASDFKIIEQSVVGEETVNGVRTTKSKIIMEDAKGNKFGGFMWDTKEGITVKMDLIAKAEGSKMRMKTELKNLKIGKQDSKLFEIPDGYKKMSMPAGFGGQRAGSGGVPATTVGLL